MKVDIFLDEFKDRIVDLGVSGVMSYLTAQAPFTRIPIVQALIKAIVRKILEILVYYTELGLYFVYADMHTTQQGKDFQKATDDLAAAKLKGDKDEIEKAKQAAIDRARDLIKFKR